MDDPDVWRVTHLWRFPDDGPKVDGFAGHNGCFPCHRHPETADWRWHWICEEGDMLFVLFLNLFEVTQTLSVSVVVSVSVVLSVCLCPPLSLSLVLRWDWMVDRMLIPSYQLTNSLSPSLFLPVSPSPLPPFSPIRLRVFTHSTERWFNTMLSKLSPSSCVQHERKLGSWIRGEIHLPRHSSNKEQFQI